MFLWEDINSSEIIDELQIKPVDNVKFISGAVLWNIEEKNYTKSAMPKLIGKKVYKSMTVRNVNTVRKLYELMLNQNKNNI